jgi:histone H3/H4
MVKSRQPRQSRTVATAPRTTKKDPVEKTKKDPVEKTKGVQKGRASLGINEMPTRTLKRLMVHEGGELRASENAVHEMRRHMQSFVWAALRQARTRTLNARRKVRFSHRRL